MGSGGDSLVILMGLKNLTHVTTELLNHGLPAETPAAVIRWGTTQAQETVTGTLADIVGKAAHLRSPAVIVIGEVAGLSNSLDWFTSAGHSGRQICSAREEDSPGFSVG